MHTWSTGNCKPAKHDIPTRFSFRENENGGDVLPLSFMKVVEHIPKHPIPTFGSVVQIAARCFIVSVIVKFPGRFVQQVWPVRAGEICIQDQVFQVLRAIANSWAKAARITHRQDASKSRGSGVLCGSTAINCVHDQGSALQFVEFKGAWHLRCAKVFVITYEPALAV